MFKATRIKGAMWARPIRFIATRIAALLMAATGSCDAGGFSDGHVRSDDAEVRVRTL